MKFKKTKTIAVMILVFILLVGCTTVQGDNENVTNVQLSDTVVEANETSTTSEEKDNTSTVVVVDETSLLDTSELFTNRDLEQTVDLSDGNFIELMSHEDVIIDEEGIYVLSGLVEEVTVIVEADDEAKVQIVLDTVSIINEESPAIYVKSADKVFITSTESQNYMEVLGEFTPDGETNLDSVIFSKSDLVLNGTGTLEIVSNDGNGITSKDDLKITGGIYTITTSEDAIEANDSIRIYDGDFTIVTNKDALHSENEDDDTLGYLYIREGNFTITATDDAIYGNSMIQIDGGTIDIITCSEGIEGTYLQINGGDISIYATDDGINAAAKTSYDVVIEVNGGLIDVKMASGDTDGFDSNGDIYINGGTISVEANSAFDSDGVVELNGGEVTVNGEITTEITQMQRSKTKRN